MACDHDTMTFSIDDDLWAEVKDHLPSQDFCVACFATAVLRHAKKKPTAFKIVPIYEPRPEPVFEKEKCHPERPWQLIAQDGPQCPARDGNWCSEKKIKGKHACDTLGCPYSASGDDGFF